MINADTPAENRRFVKKTFGTAEGGGSTGIASSGMRDGLTILCDENLEWMREYTALGETVRDFVDEFLSAFTVLFRKRCL